LAVYVLDTSAIFAVLKEEPDHDRAAALLRQARSDATTTILVPFIALMEVHYKLLVELEESEVRFWLDVVRAWPVQIVESDPQWGNVAAHIKSRGRISVGDSWMAALALVEDAILVHKDPEFDAVAGLQHLRLQYDRDRV